VSLGGAAAVVAAIGFLALLAHGLFAAVGDGASGGARVNWQGAAATTRARPAEPFTLRLLDGRTFRLADDRGALTLVNFWASWCAPCRDEAPALQAAHLAHRDRGLVLVGVDPWEREAEARRFVAETGTTYPTGVDASGRIAIDYGLRGIPETHVVDRDGRLIRRWIGPLTGPQIDALVAELLP
jgi:cytochrome c biogenesis protein CcmG/thiol:disulfide interchange protein DsbE